MRRQPTTTCAALLSLATYLQGSTVVGGGTVAYVDPLLYSMLLDEQATGGSDLLEGGQYPKTKAFFDAFGAIEPIKAWVDANMGAK